MKTIMVLKRISILFTLIFIFSVTGKNLNAQYNYLGTWNNLGVPDYLEPNGDIISPGYMLALNILLPESYSVPIHNPQWLAAGVDTETFVTDTTKIYVSYLDEGATFLNTLGYYSYDISNPPTTISNSDITIVNPNHSNIDGGGGMAPGDKVEIGTFYPGTAIGWVIVADGFDPGSSTVFQKPLRSTFYSNYDWNPEPDPTIRRHNVIWKDTTNEVYVVGFEDIRRDSTDGHPFNGCDDDFNDVLFLVYGCNWSAIDTGNYPYFPADTGTVTSGGCGGVESNGTLAHKIAHRDFMRLKDDNAIDYDDKSQLPLFTEYRQNLILNGDAATAGDELLNFIPPTSVGGSTPYITTPSDLLAATNAISIFAADYYAGNTRLGAILATETENGIYEHTKVICDRLSGATLDDIYYTTIDGQPFIMYRLIQANGMIEYATAFTAYVDGNSFEIDNQWTIGEYENRPLNYNFQVWSSSENMTNVLTADIIDLMKDYTASLTYNNAVAPDFPKVYVKSGKYMGGQVILEIANKNASTSLTLDGTKAVSETSQREPVYFSESLNGNPSQTITLNTSGVFDIDLTLTNNVSGEFDVVYFADGTWGIDYLPGGATVNDYTVDQESVFKPITSSYYQIERNVSVDGNFIEYMSIFRELAADQYNVSLSDYNAIEFTAFGTDERVMITLVNPNIPLWSEQFRSFVYTDANPNKFVVPLSSFQSAAHSTLNIDEVVTIVFTIAGDGNNWRSYELSVFDLAFTDGATGIAENEVEELNAYPNPFTNTTNIYFNLDEPSVVNINIHDITGRVVYSDEASYTSGKHNYQFNRGSLDNGVYFCEISHGNKKTKTKLVIQ